MQGSPVKVFNDHLMRKDNEEHRPADRHPVLLDQNSRNGAELDLRLDSSGVSTRVLDWFGGAGDVDVAAEAPRAWWKIASIGLRCGARNMGIGRTRSEQLHWVGELDSRSEEEGLGRGKLDTPARGIGSEGRGSENG
nr:hypothetical protein CFP56_62709 [Quercus suber]